METPEEKLFRAIFHSPKCENCGKDFATQDAFCMKCGYPNKSFSKDIFESEMGNPLEFYLENICQKGHKSEEEDYQEEPELFDGMPYCPFCGEKYKFIKSTTQGIIARLKDLIYNSS